MDHLTWRDGAATLLVAALVAAYAGWLVLGSMPLVHSAGDVAAIAFIFGFAACLVATWRLRYTTLERTIRAVERRRRKRTSPHPIDRYELQRLVALFRRMRPLYPKDALCLFDSLALLEFLAPYGCFPHWVFAVTLSPWSAHCWVQYADLCLNEDAERARQYTVILVA